MLLCTLVEAENGNCLWWPLAGRLSGDATLAITATSVTLWFVVLLHCLHQISSVAVPEAVRTY